MAIPQNYIDKCKIFINEEGEDVEDTEEVNDVQTVSLAHRIHMMNLINQYKIISKDQMICELWGFFHPNNFLDQDRNNPYGFDGYKRIYSSVFDCGNRNKDYEHGDIHRSDDNPDSETYSCCHKRYSWTMSIEEICNFCFYDRGFNLESTIDYVPKIIRYNRIN